jgi:hypothetical protein
VTRNGIARLTWQVSPRNKISLSHSEQYDRQNKTAAAAPRDARSAGHAALHAGHIQQATWTSPFTNRCCSSRLGRLPVALRQLRAARRRLAQRPDDLRRRTVLAPAAQQSAGIAGLIYRFNQPLQQGFERHQIGTIAQMRASASYIPGSHSVKVAIRATSATEPGVLQLHAVHSVPVQQRRPESAQSDRDLSRTVKYQRNILMTSFFAQDTYTRRGSRCRAASATTASAPAIPDAAVGGPAIS